MTPGPTFRERYEAAAAANDSLLCVGLDPDPGRIPDGVDTLAFLEAIVEATADLVCCFKPNAAFFESRGPRGVEELRALIAAIPDDVPVLLDAKRGDIGNSSEHYARAVFEQLGAHGVTVSPYLGRDAVEPFLAHEDRHSFVLCRTSNAGAQATSRTCRSARAGGRCTCRSPRRRARGTSTATSDSSWARRTPARPARCARCARICCC